MIFKPFFIWYKQKEWPISKLVRLHPEHVKLLETVGNYTKIVLQDNSCFEVRSSMTTALKKLPGELFIQVHRRYAVSVLYIDILEKDHLTIGEDSIPISRQRYEKVKEQLNIIE